MTPNRNFKQNPEYTQRLKQGGLYVAVAAILATHTSCGNSNGQGQWEEVTTYEVTKGLKTTLEEVEPGKYEVVDEQIVEGVDASRVFIKKLDGSIDSLSLSEARSMVGAADTVQHTTTRHHYHGGYGMGSVLYWSSFGHVMGRNFNVAPPYNVYRNGGVGIAQNVGSELKSTARTRTTLRPIQGRTGFFSRSGRSFRGG
jgi:hypothetical protein